MNFIDNRGTINTTGVIWSVNNALVEEVFTRNGRTGYIIVSYANIRNNGVVYIDLLRLNISENTIITNQLFFSICLCDIEPGMWVDASFSPAMTRSIPPQTSAFRIVVRRDAQFPVLPPREQGIIRIDRIISVDARGNMFTTGVRGDINQQMRFVVTNNTVILNGNGRRIRLRDLHSGQLVEIIHANFQTLGIPPQTTAFRVQVL